MRIPSVYDPARGLNEAPAAELVDAQMRAFGWTPRVDVVADGRPNVIATIDGDRPGRTLLFEGHTDVVTEGDESAWSVDPFGAELRDGRIYGRGSADMKSGVAAMLFAADAVVRSGSFPGRIVVAALVDEEGMMSGVRDFVARGHADGVDGAICCEPEGGEICHAAKGALRLRIDLTGKMAHGAMPFEGRNPNRAAAAVIAALTDLERRLHDAHGDARAPRPAVDHADRAARRRAGADERDAGAAPRCGSTCARSRPSTTMQLLAEVADVATDAAGEPRGRRRRSP